MMQQQIIDLVGTAFLRCEQQIIDLVGTAFL